MSEPGNRLGHYEILELIGKGGMGEVFRAKDSKLGRDVAIKVLPDHLARDEDRLRRFQREAKLLASLNHPNIASIYGLERDRGVHYLVLELVEGETLAERIARGPIRFEEAVEIGSKIADALEEAHERGVVHRDLKPANIKLTPDDKVKVLDFGLAKDFGGETHDAFASMSPTRVREGEAESSAGKSTGIGVILGTGAYMSPEQAKGKRVDKRTDIFAFGAVLYEMLTGTKAFPGDSVSEILAAVIKSEPDWKAIPRETPKGVTRVIERCLQKDSRSRFRDIGDTRLELNEMLRSPEAFESDRVASARFGKITTIVSIVLGIVLMAEALRWFVRTSEPDLAPRAAVARAIVELPPEAPLALGAGVPLIGFDSRSIALSPDGTEIVYVSGSGEGTRLYRRPVGSFEVSEIPGSEGAIHPFFSPDGEWVGFLTADQVRKTRRNSSSTGAVETLADVRTPVRATWTRNDVIYVAESQGSELSYLPADGGDAPVVIYRGASPIGDVLPDGRAAFLTDMSRGYSGDYGNVLLLDLDTLKTKLLLERGYDAHYVSTGHLIFARSGNLYAVPFDLDRREVTGDAFVIASSVAMDSLFGQAHYAISENGTFAYMSGGDMSLGKLAWVDQEGATEFLPVEERLYNVLDLSPDGRRIAVHVVDVNDYIWIYDLVRGEGRRLPAPNAGIPLWSPNGDALVYSATRGAPAVFEQALESTTPARELMKGFAFPFSWGESARTLALFVMPDWNIVFLDMVNGTTRIWESGPDLDFWGPAISPNGRWVAYASDQSGQFEIWIRSFPEGEIMRQVSVDYGVEPVWLDTGELFYRKGNQWMGTYITEEPKLSWEPPRLVFETSDFIDTKGLSYDVTADGRRLLVVKRTRPPEGRNLHVVFNWFAELEHLVPTKEYLR